MSYFNDMICCEERIAELDYEFHNTNSLTRCYEIEKEIEELGRMSRIFCELRFGKIIEIS